MGRDCRIAIRWWNIMTDSSPIILYTTPNGAVRVEVMIRNETVWLTQKALAELFGVKVPAISKHLKGIFATGELAEDAVVSHLLGSANELIHPCPLPCLP